MRRLAIKEKEIDGDLEIKKLEEETKRIVRLKELELATLSHQAQQLLPAQSHEFDVAGGRVLVKPGVTAVAVTRAKCKCGVDVSDVDLSDSFTATELDRPIRDPPPWREGGKSGTISPGAVNKPVAACVVALSSPESDTPVTSAAPIIAERDEDIVDQSKAVLQGRLRNSEILVNIESHLAHLPDAQRADVVELIVKWSTLCPTAPRN
ncbi:hypothetical protein NQZ68_022258 [Dissostichus eleginoides]|nr:hypothetical protein NQZ68_022258 [Dissostichus eleginoides]